MDEEPQRKPARKFKVRGAPPQPPPDAPQRADPTQDFWKLFEENQPGEELETIRGSFFERLRIQSRTVRVDFNPGDRLEDFREDWTCRCAELKFFIGDRESSLVVLDECYDEHGEPWEDGAMCHTSLNGKELAFTNWFVPKDTVHLVNWNPGPSKAEFERLFQTTCLSEDAARNYEHGDHAVPLLFSFLMVYLKADLVCCLRGVVRSEIQKVSIPMCFLYQWPHFDNLHPNPMLNPLFRKMLDASGVNDAVLSKLAYTEELSIAEIKDSPLSEDADESFPFLVVKPEFSVVRPDMWTWPLLGGYMEITNESEEDMKFLGLPADGKKHFVRPTLKQEIALLLTDAASVSNDDAMHLDEVRVQVENIDTGQLSVLAAEGGVGDWQRRQCSAGTRGSLCEGQRGKGCHPGGSRGFTGKFRLSSSHDKCAPYED